MIKAVANFIFGLLVLFIAAILLGGIVMLFWNWLMPILFFLPTINFAQGWGLAVLSGLLFKSSSPSVKFDFNKE